MATKQRFSSSLLWEGSWNDVKDFCSMVNRFGEVMSNSKVMVMVVINNKAVKQTTHFLLNSSPCPGGAISFITGEKQIFSDS